MGNEKAEELIRKYLAGTATPEEEALLESWYIMAAQNQPEMQGEPDYPRIEAEILEPLRAEQPNRPKTAPVVRIWPRIAAAAAVLLIVGLGSIFYYRRGPSNIPPASQREGLTALAILTLSDGRQVSLEDIPVGGTIADGDLRIAKPDSMTVSYSRRPAAGKGVYNTLATAKGGQYRVVLPDGSQVWLNSLATLRYPVVFSGSGRIVQVTGEAYFEIARDPAAPFRVNAPGMDVQVLGTSFDIMAYTDETTVRTTLVDGSVAVSRGDRKSVLQPGEQALGSTSGIDSISVVRANMEEVLAWRRGEYRFKKTPIQPIMRQLARWYDVTIVYSGPVSKASFSGVMTRKGNFTQMLDALEISGDVHFVIKDKNITVVAGPR